MWILHTAFYFCQPRAKEEVQFKVNTFKNLKTWWQLHSVSLKFSHSLSPLQEGERSLRRLHALPAMSPPEGDVSYHWGRHRATHARMSLGLLTIEQNWIMTEKTFWAGFNQSSIEAISLQWEKVCPTSTIPTWNKKPSECPIWSFRMMSSPAWSSETHISAALIQTLEGYGTGEENTCIRIPNWFQLNLKDAVGREWVNEKGRPSVQWFTYWWGFRVKFSNLGSVKEMRSSHYGQLRDQGELGGRGSASASSSLLPDQKWTLAQARPWSFA